MKLYTKTISQTLPDWATVVTQSADLIEVEISDEHPSFQSLLEELATEIEPGTIGVKAEDLCSRLGFDLSNPPLHRLVEQAQALILSNRSGIPITEEDLQHPGGFWHWVWRHNVPVTIVEGVKKAGTLLTAGYAAMA